jgi:uncharacterized membrane protein YhhN
MELTNRNEFIHYVIAGILAISAIVFAQIDCNVVFWVLKPLTTIAILFIPLLYGVSINRKYYRRLVIALVLCLLGDVLLLNPDWFLYGLAAFFVAHLFYIFAFLSYRGLYLKLRPFLVLLGIGGGFYAFVYDGLGELQIPVAFYILCLVFMCWQAIGLYYRYENRRFRFVMLGSVLFLISDAILALDKFKFSFDTAEIFVLLTYWMAIGAFAISTTFDLRD